MKCPNCGRIIEDNNAMICPKCRKFIDPELNLIDDLDRTLREYQKPQEPLPHYEKYHVSTYDVKRNRSQSKNKSRIRTQKKPVKKKTNPLLVIIIIAILFAVLKIFLF